jgi:DNA-binding protein H-NS
MMIRVPIAPFFVRKGSSLKARLSKGPMGLILPKENPVGISAPYFGLSWVIEAASRRRNTFEKFVLNRRTWEGGRMKIDRINSMSVDDLWSLREKLDSLLSKKLSEEKERLNRRIRQLERGDASLTVARRPYPRVLPKYRNPDRPSQTWAGRGKKPRWIVAQLRSGKRLDDFRIQPS